MNEPPWTIGEVNHWDRATFVARLGGVFESSPWIVERVWSERPFFDVADLHTRLRDAVHAAEATRQLALIRAHPDLVGQAALAGTLTRESRGEQAAAGIDPGSLSADDIAQFTALNHAYTARFGFPFVICARDNKKSEILAGLRTRVTNLIDEERRTALDEIAKIAWYRLTDAISESSVTGVQSGHRVGG